MLDLFLLLKYLIKNNPNKKARIYAILYQRISKNPKENMTGSIEGCMKIIILNYCITFIMVNKSKILSDLSKMAVDAMSTFNGLRKEVEVIVSLRVNKIINKMNLVKRDEFEVLKKLVQKMAIENEKLKKKSSKNNNKSLNAKKKKIIKKKTKK